MRRDVVRSLAALLVGAGVVAMSERPATAGPQVHYWQFWRELSPAECLDRLEAVARTEGLAPRRVSEATIIGEDEAHTALLTCHQGKVATLVTIVVTSATRDPKPKWNALVVGFEQGAAKTAVVGQAAAAPAATPTEQPAATAASAAGPSSWKASFGLMELHVSKTGQATGIFPESDGRIFGRIAGRALTGFWVFPGEGGCATDYAGSTNWGRAELQFDEAENHLAGRWGYCDEEPTRAWVADKL